MAQLRNLIIRRKERLLKAAAAVVAFWKAFGGWIFSTLLNPWKLENVKQVLTELTALFQDATACQSDPSISQLRSAYRDVTKNNLLAADNRYKEAIRLNPRNSEAYLLRAKCLTYLQGNPTLVDQELKLGLKLNELVAHEKGLDVLNLKILGDEFAGMGHLSLLDPLVKLRKLGIIENQHLMVVSEASVANVAYLNCWKKHLPILVTNAKNYSAFKSLLSPIFEEVSMFEGKLGYLPLYEAWNLALNSWGNSPPVLELSLEQREEGERVLDGIGLKKGSWFVGLHVREGEKGGLLRSGADSDILDYIPAIQRIREKGGWVIRMGKSGKPLKKMPNLWDYSNSAKLSDWMDVYLWASCKFFIGTSSGPLSVPPTFGRPVLYTNACAIGTSPNFRHSLMIPKLFWSNKKNRLLTFEEMLEGPYGWTVLPEYDEGQTRLVSNSPAEILVAVDEMITTLNNPEIYSNKTDNQEAFDRVRTPFKSTAQARIAESFANSHCELFR